VIIVAISPAAASGVSAPARIRVPPIVSVALAAIALRRPGRISSESIIAVAFSRPGPPNQPNHFCVPWPMKMAPMTMRASSFPSFICRPPASSLPFRSPAAAATNLHGHARPPASCR
jgi:hypothetical protein